MSIVVTLQGKNVVEMATMIKGQDPRLSDIQNATFTDVALADGTEFKDLTFAQLQDILVTLQPKNVVSLTYEQKN